jgi:uncharacterized protein (TIGR00251 family)
MKLTETKDGIIIEVFVKPNQPRFRIEVDDEIVVFSTEEPVKSKVNKEIIKQLSKLFHAKVELVSGAERDRTPSARLKALKRRNLRNGLSLECSRGLDTNALASLSSLAENLED